MTSIKHSSYHPEFHAGNLYNDISMIKLDGKLRNIQYYIFLNKTGNFCHSGRIDFQSNPHISPVCLPDVFQVLKTNHIRDSLTNKIVLIIIFNLIERTSAVNVVG